MNVWYNNILIQLKNKKNLNIIAANIIITIIIIIITIIIIIIIIFNIIYYYFINAMLNTTWKYIK